MSVKKYNDIFEYFIGSYFNWSMDYTDLSDLADQYLNGEIDLWVAPMRTRVRELYDLNSPQHIKDLVFLYGRRALTLEEAQDMIELLYRKFCS
jgi:hypothetical protein